MIILKDNKVTARKEHICDLCGLPIHKGSKYFYKFIKDDEAYDFKNHCHCESIVYYLCYLYCIESMGKYEFNEACQQILQDTVYPSQGLTSEQINEKLSHYYDDKELYLKDIIKYMNEHDNMSVVYEE